VTEPYRFGYHPDLLARFPTLTAGVAFAKRIDNESDSVEVESLLRAQEDAIKELFASTPISSHPHISSWRSAFSSFGVKPTKHRCAVEALLRHVLKSGAVPHINKLVDLCNYVSMKHVLPVAAYDLAFVSGPVEVRFATGDEPFLPLYAKEIEYPKPGEVAYTDDEGALSRRWTWRQCDRAKSTPQSLAERYLSGLPPRAARLDPRAGSYLTPSDIPPLVAGMAGPIGRSKRPFPYRGRPSLPGSCPSFR